MEDEKNRDIEAHKQVEQLRRILEILNTHGIDYYVVGSLARIAYIQSWQSRRNSSEGKSTPLNIPCEAFEKSSPEINLLIPDREQYEEAKKILDIPSLSVKVDLSLSNFLRREDGKFFLTHGGVRIPVEGKLFEPVVFDIEGTEFRTLKPETLLHTYVFVGGPFREKDWTNALEFARAMRKQKIVYDHSEYEPFHKFGRIRWRNSPLRRVQYAWRMLINSMPEDVRERVLQVYNFTPIRLLRSMFNKMEEATCGVLAEGNLRMEGNEITVERNATMIQSDVLLSSTKTPVSKGA